ncbi:hypothetical protein ACF0H5_021295 [Mactra antiquata]
MKITLFATLAFSAVVGMTLADELWNNWNNNNGWNNNNNGGFGGISIGSVGGASYYPSGLGSGYGSAGYGAGYGHAQAQYVPVPYTGATGAAGGNLGLMSILPIFFLLFLLPNLFSSTGTSDQILLINSTLEG